MIAHRRCIRASVCVGLVAAAALVARAVEPRESAAAVVGQWGACGSERSAVKSLQDRPRLLKTRPATIAELANEPRPPSLATRAAFERHVFTVEASVVLKIREADQDLHLVLQGEGGNRMIAEATSPMCATNATPLRKRQIAEARDAVELCVKARVTGVAFFDFKHRQTGVAPNAIELHPILHFVCLTN